MSWAAVWAATCLAVPTEAAPAVPKPSRDSVYASLRPEDLSPGGSGVGLEVGWLHTVTPRFSSDVGGAFQAQTGARWRYVRLGALARPSGKTVVQAETRLGSGEREDTGFPYRTYRAQVSHALRPGRLYADLEDQYVQIDEARGHILQLAATVLGAAWNARVAGHASAGGNLGARYVSGRLGHTRGRLGLFVGASAGRMRPELLSPFPGDSGERESTEAYAGFSLTAGQREIMIALDRVRAGGVSRHALVTVVKLRL